MSTTDTDIELEAAIADARENFDLDEFLSGRARNTKSQKVFTDEVTAKALGGEYPEYGPFGHVTGTTRAGVMGQIYDIYDLRKAEQPYDEEGLDRLLKEADELVTKLEESALTIELRSINDDEKNQAKRKAKKALGINGKVAAVDEEEFNRKDFAYVVARSIISLTTAAGQRRKHLSVEDVEKLRDKLPTGEFNKIHGVVMELSYKAAVAKRYTLGDPDFSPAG